MKKHSNYIISGCGISGMITALSLARYNIYSTIVEAKSAKDEGFFSDIRTTALTSSSKEFFESIGIWEVLSDLIGPINDIYVVDNKSPELLHFSPKDTPKNELMGYLIENSAFKKRLYDLVLINKFINVLDGVKYQEIINSQNGCEVSLSNGTTLIGKLLIICDGSNSRAKSRFFTNKIVEDYQQSALTFIVHHEKNHEGTAVEHFMPAGPFAILPLKDVHKSSIVWTMPRAHASVMMNLPLDELNYLVQENFGPFLGAVTIVSNRAIFPLKAYAACKYYNKSLVLVADTAHIIHPLAGQGLNQGIKDIDCLTNLIAKNSIEPGAILHEYQQLRKCDNENMLLLTDTINSVFSSNSKILLGARQAGFKAIEKISPFKELIIKYAMGKR